ncbi:unnamed protein product, partial [Linum tenue]
ITPPVLLNQTLEELVGPFVSGPHPSLKPTEIDPPQHRQEIHRIRRAAQIKRLPYQLLEPLPFVIVTHFAGARPKISLSGDHPHHDVHRQPHQPRPHFDLAKAGTRVDQPVDQALDLVLADVEEGVEAGGGEELDGGEAAEVAPVGPVRRVSQGGAVVADDFPAE